MLSSNICHWFVDNKLTIQLKDDKTKSIPDGSLDVKHGAVHIQ